MLIGPVSSDQSGWAWFIPLHDGTTSIGVVMSQAIYNERVRALKGSSLEDRYRFSISLAPGLVKLIGPGRIVQKNGVDGQPDQLIRSASDFSYSASSYGGPGFRLIGDAGGTNFSLFFIYRSTDVKAFSVHRSIFLLRNTPCDDLWTICGGVHMCCGPRRLLRG